MMFARTGLRARLMMLALLAVVPAFGLITYGTVAQRHQAAADVERDAMSLVQVAVAKHSELVASTRQLLIGISRLPDVMNADPATCSQTLADLRRPYRYYANFGMASPAGDVYCSALPLNQPVNIADRPYFRRAVASGDLGIGDFQRGRITGIESINFAYPVIDGAGKSHGVIYAALDLSWLNQLVTGVNLTSGSTVTVTDAKGIVLARYPGGERWVGKSTAGSPLAQAIRAQPGGGTAALRDIDGVYRLYAFAPLSKRSGGDAYVSIGTPAATAFAPVKRHFETGVALLLMVAAAVLAAAWFGGDVFVLRQVRALADTAVRLRGGDLGARTGLQRGGDELGRLARAFDDMAATLQRIDRARRTAGAGNRAVVRAASETVLLNEMCRIIVEVGGYRYAWAGFAFDDDDKTVQPVAQAGFEGGLPALRRSLIVSWADSQRGRGPVGTAIRTGQPYVAQNIHVDPCYTPWRSEAIKRGYAAVSAFPLQIQGRVIGALAIYSDESDAFNADEMDLLVEAAEDLAFGIATLRTRADHDRAHETIRRMAYYDGLTGLPNHIYFDERLTQLLRDGGGADQALAVMLLNVDRFREINDALGYHQGDMLLREAGERLRRLLPDDATVARMRGDEFAVVSDVRDAAHAAETALRIHDALEQPFVAGGLTLHMGATVGIALYPQHGGDAAALVRHADVARHQAQHDGNRYAIYAREQDEDGAGRLALAAELRGAIEEGSLILYYQPKVRLQDSTPCGMEALVRWIHPHRGMIAPDMFIPLAEHTGLIKPLTDWVLQTALQQAAAWRAEGLQLPVAVNLSARNLRDAELVDKIEGLLAIHGLGADALALEITESAVMEDPEGAMTTLIRLRQLGVRLYIDDFGTGYSSLGYLKRLPVDSVKIDKSFVIDMLENSDSEAIVRSTISLAHELNLYVVAEGIEHLAVWERLQAMGCDVGQGYYISRPVPARQLHQWLARRAQAAAPG